MYRVGLADTLVTHANMKGFGLASLTGAGGSFGINNVKNTKAMSMKTT